MNKILLDTNAYTKLLGGDGMVLDALGAADTVYVSVVVVAELLTGFKGGSKEKKNLALLNDFLSKPTVKILNATYETAEAFSFIKHGLKRAGTPIPINDVWVAAHALETGSTLVTFDRHFKAVAGLRMWNSA
jgi:tRNA(fMet)-specific endonuclease VapC